MATASNKFSLAGLPRRAPSQIMLRCTEAGNDKFKLAQYAESCFDTNLQPTLRPKSPSAITMSVVVRAFFCCKAVEVTTSM